MSQDSRKNFQELLEESKQYFPTEIQLFQFMDKYSRFDWDKMRRETWVETVDRAVDYLKWLSKNKLTDEDYELIREHIAGMKAMPSMRLLASAGEQAKKNPVSIYNCSFIPVDSPEAWVEALFISMSACGVGFSVEKQHVEKLPKVKEQTGEHLGTHIVEDSTEGWMDAFRRGLDTWFSGRDIDFDFSMIRPAGSVLKTKGGRASGPQCLMDLFKFARETIIGAQGRKLTTLEAHDIMCEVGTAAVSGGHRRCLEENTYVHLKRGLVKIKNVKVGDEAMTEVGYKPVVDVVDQGIQNTIKVTFENGHSIVCTPDHRFAVLENIDGSYEFKQAQDLAGEDRVMFITNEIDGENLKTLPKIPDYKEADKIRTDIKQPELNEETAWILGMLLANGTVYFGKNEKAKVSFSNHVNKNRVNEKIIDWFTNLGINTSIQGPTETDRSVKITCDTRRLARWFGNFKESNIPVAVPESILKSNHNIKCSFLSGVFDGDGTKDNRPLIVVSTVSEQFSKEIYLLLASIGIISEISKKDRKKENWQTIYTVNIKDHNSKNKFIEYTKDYRCLNIPTRIGKQFGYTIPKEFIKNQLPRKIWKDKYSAQGDRGLNSSTFQELTGIDHYIPVKIKSIENYGEVNTYDISVQDQHVFVAEGFLVHNTAMISLFDKDDDKMRNCKDGEFPERRWNANNSAVWIGNETPSQITRQLLEMDEGGRGEPGIFSRSVANGTMPSWREKSPMLGANPCCEISLRPRQFCNLSIAVARHDDTKQTLMEKVKVATIIGTIQSMATNFKNISPEWQANCEEERLLGVDITGQADCPLLNRIIDDEKGYDDAAELFSRLREHAVKTNEEYAEKLGIPRSASITCVKPSGNSSQLLDCSPGLHFRHYKYYIRNIRVGTHTPIFKVLKESGVPMDPENGQDPETANAWVIHFPVAAPEGSKTQENLSALEMLKIWEVNKKFWTHHNPSTTVSYTPEELPAIINWVWDNKEIISGISFLPKFDAKYDQMPYQVITKEEYEKAKREFPEIDWSKLFDYEKSDMTEAAQLLACVSGACLI